MLIDVRCSERNYLVHQVWLCYNVLMSLQTYSGNILIALNPFQPLSHLYDVYVMERYKGALIEGLSPHVFTIADVAYR